MNICPKCGAGMKPKGFGWVCGTWPVASQGGVRQSKTCRIAELEADNAQLRALIGTCDRCGKLLRPIESFCTEECMDAQLEEAKARRAAKKVKP
jgi:hypothetical protein